MIVFCSTQKAEAQITSLANGLPDTVILSCTKGSDLYVLTRKSKATTDTLKTYHWNGSSWTKLFSFFFHNPNNYQRQRQVNTIQYYNNELYLGGKFDAVSDVPGFNNLMKWDGNDLISLDTIVSASQVITCMLPYKNALIIAGNSNSPFVHSWNGTSVMEMDSVQDGYESYWFGHHLFVSGDQLYANLRFKGPLNVNFGLWNGNYWEPKSYPSDSIWWYEQPMNNDDVLAITKKGVERFQSGNWKVIAPGLDKILIGKNVLQMISFKNTIWILAQLMDTIDTRTVTLFKWDGESWGKVLDDTKTYRIEYNFIKSDEALYLYGNFEDFGGLALNYIGKISELAKFSGNVFYDINSNCNKDSSDFSNNRSFISISPGALSTINTDDDGNYTFYADSGTYNIKTIPAKYWKQSCTANNTVTVNAKIDSEYVNNFAISSKYSVQDVRITLTGSTGWRARKGFTENYTLCYENVGTTTAKGTISLLLDSTFTNFSSTPTALNYTYPLAEWKFDSLEIGEKKCITFKARIDSATINDSVQLVTAFEGGDSWIDSSYNDNIDTLKQRIVASLDPNDKTSYPEGNITEKTKELRYQIRFQNTGTDTAYRVTVIDTVDTNLPLTKVMMNSASHKYKLDIKNNVFKWTFDGIMLPDSTTNEELSHGFINYTAQIKPGLAISTEIKNTAYIYFDYQKPVITNTARSKMTEPVGIREEKIQSISSHLHIYPNPASMYLYIKNDDKEAKELLFVNILGQVLKTLKVQPFEIQKVQTEELKSGIYFIQTAGEKTQKLIIE